MRYYKRNKLLVSTYNEQIKLIFVGETLRQLTVPTKANQFPIDQKLNLYQATLFTLTWNFNADCCVFSTCNRQSGKPHNCVQQNPSFPDNGRSTSPDRSILHSQLVTGLYPMPEESTISITACSIKMMIMMMTIIIPYYFYHHHHHQATYLQDC